MRKGVGFKPRQQAFGGRADHVKLRVMNVHVDKAGGDDAVLQMLRGYARKARRQLAVTAHRLHHLPPPGIRPHHQQAVGFQRGFGGAGKIQDGGAIGFHAGKVTPRAHPAIEGGGYFVSLPCTPCTRKFMPRICSSLSVWPAASTS